MRFPDFILITYLVIRRYKRPFNWRDIMFLGGKTKYSKIV